MLRVLACLVALFALSVHSSTFFYLFQRASLQTLQISTRGALLVQLGVSLSSHEITWSVGVPFPLPGFATCLFFFFFKLLSLCPTVKLWGDTSRSAQLSVALVSGTWSYGTCSFHLTSFYPPQNQRNDSVRCCLNTIRSTKMSWSWRSATSWTF